MKLPKISFMFLFGLGVLNLSAYAHAAESYHDLRTHLLKQGWEPLVTNDVMSDGTPEKNAGDTRVMVNAGFIEVELCSNVERNYCIFNWRKKSICLQIKTEGEFNAAYNSPTVLSKQDRLCSLIPQRHSPRFSRRL